MINHNDKEIKWKNKIPSIVHFEIPADDVERARKFYSTLFGWKIEKIEVRKDGDTMDYWMISTSFRGDSNEKSSAIEGGLIETGPSTTKLELHKCTFNRRILEKG